MYFKELLPIFVAAGFFGIIASVALPLGRVSSGSEPLPLGLNQVTSVVQKGRLFDRFGDVPLKDERVRLDNFVLQLQKSDAKAYVVVYGKRRGVPGEAKKRADRAKWYLIYDRGIAKDRITSLDHCVRPKLEFELWIVPGDQKIPCQESRKPTTKPTK